jgi:hypothetical protein
MKRVCSHREGRLLNSNLDFGDIADETSLQVIIDHHIIVVHPGPLRYWSGTFIPINYDSINVPVADKKNLVLIFNFIIVWSATEEGSLVRICNFITWKYFWFPLIWSIESEWRGWTWMTTKFQTLNFILSAFFVCGWQKNGIVDSRMIRNGAGTGTASCYFLELGPP